MAVSASMGGGHLRPHRALGELGQDGVAPRVGADRVALGGGALYGGRPALDLVTHQEERGRHARVLKRIQQLIGVRAGTVVKGQRRTPGLRTVHPPVFQLGRGGAVRIRPGSKREPAGSDAGPRRAARSPRVRRGELRIVVDLIPGRGRLGKIERLRGGRLGRYRGGTSSQRERERESQTATKKPHASSLFPRKLADAHPQGEAGGH